MEHQLAAGKIGSEIPSREKLGDGCFCLLDVCQAWGGELQGVPAHLYENLWFFFLLLFVCLIRSFGTLNAEPYELSEIGD